MCELYIDKNPRSSEAIKQDLIELCKEFKSKVEELEYKYYIPLEDPVWSRITYETQAPIKLFSVNLILWYVLKVFPKDFLIQRINQNV
ncbi:hypothetical protein UFOVP67_43 [uncultured Caudovirales phage]|uniref:Uncharacterized protein n=1 Tax=uncultured Caudovirales phage TaxID=2100421 RepID=A0A6J5T8T8_9CAUD|nr:hypothetical protein UFOVP67_43 [uncultured Caudovirales phage]